MLSVAPYRSASARLSALAVAVAWCCGLPATALADPPPWAPANGYRAKHVQDGTADGAYAVYAVPYGIDRGICDRSLLSRELLGGAIGGAAGGLVGHQVGGSSGRTAATIGGIVAGALVGSAIGRAMDIVDQNCVGFALEHATDRRRIEWDNAESGYQYSVVPTRTYQTNEGRYCREYQTMATVGGQRQGVYGTACRQPDGSWRIVN
jgi:surface antigen